MIVFSKFKRNTKPRKYKSKHWYNSNVFQFIFLWYLVFVLVGAGLLMAPISVNWKVADENNYNFMSALFTATSAFSDTGLVVTPTDTTFKPFGQVVIYLLILIGGIGLMVVFLLIYKSFFPKRKLRFDSIVLLQSERGSEDLTNTMKLIVSGVVFILSVNIFCSLLLMFCFYYIPAHLPVNVKGEYFAGFSKQYEPQYHNWVLAFWSGMFDSVSALDNAGFSLFGEDSLTAYRNGIGICSQFILMLEWMLGGMGFPVVYEIYQWIKAKIHHKKFNFSLFTKICLIGIISVLAISTALAYTFSYTGTSRLDAWSLMNAKNYAPDGKLNTIYSPWGTHPNVNKNFAIFFNCVSTRSAGFDSYNLNNNSESLKILYGILMFIGSSPSSTGGGIRITTFIIVTYALGARISGKDHVSMFKKTISKSTINDSFLIFLFALIIVIISTTIVHFTFIPGTAAPSLNNYVNDFFVVSSAIGTCGLSVGTLTNDLAWGGLLALIITMFIGQLGISTAILSVARTQNKDITYTWPVEDVRVG